MTQEIVLTASEIYLTVSPKNPKQYSGLSARSRYGFNVEIHSYLEIPTVIISYTPFRKL